ncbi:MAG: glycosyltransferase family 9 protein [Planctomycetes bacterium]|nr:glycosyltransferase family 9 protein [Planctomycetota bacterium]
MKLAIRAPNWVGDLVMATPVCENALKDRRFESVTIIVRKHLASILNDGPCAASVRPIGSDAEEIDAYRALSPDAVLLLTNSFGAAWRARRAGVKIRAGAALSGRRFLLTHCVVPPTIGGRRAPIPTAHLLRDVAGLLGVLVPDLHPRLAVREEIVARESERLANLGIAPDAGYVVCCPGAAFGAAKLWRPARFAEALDELHREFGWRGVVTGGPGEEALMDAVADAATSDVVSLAREARDLEGLKALVRGARLLLVGDSGPRWFAAAFDIPCVSIMGPNFPELTASSLEHAEIVRVEDLDCSPCLERVCPLGHHRCMEDIPVERVTTAARRVLARSVSRA